MPMCLRIVVAETLKAWHSEGDSPGGKKEKRKTWEKVESKTVRNRLRVIRMSCCLSLVRSVRRTWAGFRKRYGCWRLICVWRKWRERWGRSHPTGRKRPVEVMAGVGGGGVPGSCLMAVCSAHTHIDSDTRGMLAGLRNTARSHRTVSIERNAESRCQSMHSEEVPLNVYLHATALHRIQLCQV